MSSSEGIWRVPRCLIHVGAPKTGTTYLQQVLFRNQQTLAKRGLLVPGGNVADHHGAALDLRGVSMGTGTQTKPVSAWQRLVDEARSWDGDIIISSELLAWATDAQVERALASFPNHEVHIVFTARDLVRQIPAVWQEEVKNRRTMSFERFVERLDTGDDRDLGPGNIWGGQDVRRVVGTWAASVPPERVHIVTVPPKGAPTSSLLERYCSVLGVDAGTLDPRSGEANVGLGTTQVELLRQINLKLSPEFTWRSYDRLVKHGIALGPLAAGQGTEKVSLPSSAFPVVAARTERMLAWIRDAGYAVVGDLADLLVRHPEPVVSRPTEAEPEESADALLEAGSTTIAHLLQRLDAAYALIEQQAEPPVQRQAEPEGAGPEEAAPEAAAPEATTDGDVPSAPTQAAQSVIGPARPRHDPRRPGQHTAFVFVGPPKVGLDCLQSQLATHSHALADQGVRVAGSSAEDRWRAAAGLVPEEFPRARWDGGRAAWDALAEEVRGRKGTWLVAHDLLAGASEAEARKALAALAPAEVHVVAIMRGVDRQLPAEWLEHVRGGGRQAFEHFLNAAVVDAERSPHRTWFWHVQDVVEVLNRWAADLPGNRVHVITGTAGPEGTRTTWQRLCAVLGVDPARLPLPEDASRLEPRPSGAEVLRQLNQVLSRRTQEVAGRPHLTTAYSRVLAHNLLSGLLADSPEGSGVVLPPELHGWARHRTEATMAAIAQAGYDVVGDLDELEPEPIRLDVVPPGRVPDRQLLTTALELLASVTERMLSGPEGMTTRQFAGYAVRRVSGAARRRLRRRR